MKKRGNNKIGNAREEEDDGRNADIYNVQDHAAS